MSNRNPKPWIVECDDEAWRFATRREALEYAARIRRHPANADIRQFGPYRNVDGQVRVRHEIAANRSPNNA